jgi:hypothetical protein
MSPAPRMRLNDLHELLGPKVEGLIADFQGRGVIFALLAPVQAAVREFAA